MTPDTNGSDERLSRILMYGADGSDHSSVDEPSSREDVRRPDAAMSAAEPAAPLTSREPQSAPAERIAAGPPRNTGALPRGDLSAGLEVVRREVQAEVVTILKQRGLVDDGESMYDAARDVALELLISQAREPLTQAERDDVARSIAEEIDGLGPIQYLLDDPRVGEIMVNGPQQVYFEVEGRLHRSPRRFQDDDHVTRVVERMLLPLGRRIDEQSPMVDARLPDGSRVNVIIPPLAVDGPVITIRRFSQDPFISEDLIRMGSMTVPVARLLEACVGSRLNILVSGGTGSGKTTFLNVLSSFIPEDQRLVTIEDPAELQLRQPHVVRLETRPPNLIGKGAVTQRELLANALRMRPDRIIIGEVRSGEAFDMLQAMNTGHDGSLTTVHANTPRDALARVENMVLMAGMDLPQRAVREQISSALQIVVQLSRMPSGARGVTHVAEITGMESGTVTMQDLFVYRRGGVVAGDNDSELVATGLLPHVTARMTAAGFALDPKIFEPPNDGEPSW